MSELEIANIVASGRLGVELDLGAVASSEKLNQDSRIESIEHSQKSGQRVLVRFFDGPALGILSRKGACIITGAKSYDGITKTKEELLGALDDAEVIPYEDIEEFEIQNIVFTTALAEPVDLNALAVLLGLERVEYEPEQFPGLLFRPDNTSCVILVFGSGNIVLTGIQSEKEATKQISKLRREYQ